MDNIMSTHLQDLVPASAIYQILRKLEGTKQYDLQKEIFLSQIPEEDRLLLKDIEDGTKLPPITVDMVFKKVFDPVNHPDRLEYLLRGVSGIKTIKVGGTIANEGYRESIFAKNIIFDLPASSTDGLMTNTEMQVAAQKFILKRGEIISANQMMIQYSASEGQTKGDVDFDNVPGTLLTVMMKGTPKDFSSFKSDHYIHIVNEAKANTGLTYKTLQTIVYVELAKCLRQYKKGINGESDNRLQAFLAMISDVNEAKVLENIKDIYSGEQILNELKALSKSKEVGAMLLAERYAAADFNAAIAHARDEGELKGALNKSLQVYDNCRKRGFSKEEAIGFAGFPVDFDTSSLT